MTKQTTSQLNIVGTIDRVVGLLRSDFATVLAERIGDDTEVTNREWSVYPHLMWEDGWAVGMDMPGLFVHCSSRNLVEVDGQGVKPAGPDLTVGVCVRSHRERLGPAVRLVTYAIEALCDIAQANDYRPHVRGAASYGRPESVDWSAYGTVVFGPVDGAPQDWL